MELNMLSGIYSIYCKSNNKLYIGSSKNIHLRFRTHINKLNKKIHPNKYLQNSWNLYEEKNFIFEPIKINVNNDELLKIEQIYLDDINKFPDKYFNIAKEALAPFKGLKHKAETIIKLKKEKLGNKNPMFNKKFSAEHKLKLSKSHKRWYKENKHPLFGKHLSESHKLKLKKANSGVNSANYGKILTEEQKFKLSIKKQGCSHPRYDHTIYSFFNKQLNIQEHMTRYELCRKYNLIDTNLTGLIKGQRKSVKGWILKDQKWT
jgi:group I intron endonuclease